MFFSKKIDQPFYKEFAIGAVTLSDIMLSDDGKRIPNYYITEEVTRIRAVLKQQQDMYYGINAPLSLNSKIVILVDDGVTTGQTLISSIKLIDQQQPSQIILALPVGPPSVIKKINNIPSVKKTICLLKPLAFQSVRQFYKNFNQVDNKEVIRLLSDANHTLSKN